MCNLQYSSSQSQAALQLSDDHAAISTSNPNRSHVPYTHPHKLWKQHSSLHRKRDMTQFCA
jgi:hypothetical protein